MQKGFVVMNNRIKQLRKALNLSQKDFGKAIGAAITTISGYETGRDVIGNRILTTICNTFNANPEWLRTGKGEMFLTSSKSSVEDLRKEYNLSNIEYELIKSYLDLPVDKRNEFAKILIGMVKK